MGQYFCLVNTEKKEWISLPGGMKLPEIVAHDMAPKVMTYMMFEGPFDGTTLLDRLYDVDDPKVAEATADWIEDEKERYADSDRSSVYQNDDGTWQYDKIKRSVCAGFTIGEDSICGRWAGNRVRIVGDYAESGLYNAMDGTIIAETESGKRVSWSGRHPEKVEEIECDGPGKRVRHYDVDARPGDEIRLSTQADGVDSHQHGTFVEFKDSEWTNITSDVFDEMARYMPERFGELADDAQHVTLKFGTGANTRA